MKLPAANAVVIVAMLAALTAYLLLTFLALD